MKVLNVELVGTEVSVTGIVGYYAYVTNMTESDLYVSTTPGITPSQAIRITKRCSRNIAMPYNSTSLFLLGNGTAYIEGTDKPLAESVTTDYVDSTASDLAKDYVTTNASNPNLLINPDFHINQRGQSEYTTAGYTVDGWKISGSGVAISANSEGGIRCSTSTDIDANGKSLLVQYNELDMRKFSGSITISVRIADISINQGIMIIRARFGDKNNAYLGAATITFSPTDTAGIYHASMPIPENAEKFHTDITAYDCSAGSYVDIMWIKVENASDPTLFIPPDPTLELLKCQRYYQLSTKGDTDLTDVRPNIPENGSVVKRTDDKYAYISEL